MPGQYVIPDLHGCAATLKYVIEEIIRPVDSDKLYFLGDFINKGPDSKGVLDYIFQLKEKISGIRAVRGNHEQALLNAVYDPAGLNAFLEKGGRKTLASFHVDNPGRIPVRYINFIENLPYYIQTDQYIIVHAGLNFSIDDPLCDTASMLTIRDYRVLPEKTGNRKVIHGHNAVRLPEILHSLENSGSGKINLDNGCVYVQKEGMGNLVVLNLQDFSYTIQPCSDKI